MDVIRPELVDVLRDIEHVRDAVRGGNHVKSLSDKYLPRIDGQDQEEYERYVERAYFAAATALPCYPLNNAPAC